MDFRLKLRIIWITALVAMVLALVWMSIVPGGKITYSTNLKGHNNFIGNLTPSERMAGNKIVGDPAYFSLRVPRRFTNARLTLKYQADPNVSIIEAGVLKDQATWQYDLQPIYNGKIEELMKSWSVLTDGNTMLLQREKKFISISDFLKNPPEPGKIALYNYTLNNHYTLADYKVNTSTIAMCRPLTGSYQFYTYVKNENLVDDFVFEDLNKNSDPDPIDVYVYYNDKQIFADHLDDDGVATDAGIKTPWRHLRLNLAGLPEGIYKIGVRANNDIVTRMIETPQIYMTFVNKINLASAPEVSCGRNLFTDSRQVQAQTVYSDNLQTIKILPLDKGEIDGVLATGTETIPASSYQEEELVITEAFKQFSIELDFPGRNYLLLENDGVMISGDGLFAFGPEQFINPKIRKIGATFEADKEKIDYILANYTPPAKDGDWFVSTADFDLQNVYKQWNKHSFLISVPGLKAEDGDEEGVIVGGIKIELQGTSIWEKMKKIFNF